MSTRGGTSEDSWLTRDQSETRATLTCNINVMVSFKPSLSAQKIMLCYQEDYVFGPVDLP